MTEWIIIIFSIVILLLIALFIFYFFNFSFKENSFNENSSILFFVEFDLKKWRFRRTHSLLELFIASETNEKFLKYMDKKFGSGWSSISNLFKLIDDEESQKIKKAIEYCVQNKSNITIPAQFTLKSFTAQKQNVIFLFYLKFKFINDNKIMVECRSNEQPLNHVLKKKIISKNELFQDNKKFKLFVAFSIFDSSKESFIAFIQKINEIIKIKQVRFFKSNSTTILVISSNSYNIIKKQSKKISNKLLKNSHKTNINNYYNGITYVECQDLKTEGEFSKIMTRIVFGLIKSKIQFEPIFFNLNYIHLNEFNDFKEKIIKINQMMELNELNYEIIPIKSITNKKNLYNFYVLKFNFKDDYWNEYILKINDYDLKIKDRFIDYIIKINNDNLKESFIHINDYKMLDLIEQLKNYENFIFIINRVKFVDTKQFIQLLHLLELSKIKFGLYVNELDSELYSVISNIKPRVILLSSEFNTQLLDNDIKSQIKIMSAILMFENLNIKLIFTNINKEMQNKISIIFKKEKYFIDKSSHGIFEI